MPTGLTTGELAGGARHRRVGRKSTLGITLTVATPQMHAAKPPVSLWTRVKHPGGDRRGDQPGDLILVKPGVYEEMVVMTKPVRLQGAGALSTIINVVTTPAENVQNWLDKVGNLLAIRPRRATCCRTSRR